MENVIDTIVGLFSNYGIRAACIILIVIVATNLIKKPIVSYALAYARKHDTDKSVVTRYVTLLPIGVSFIVTFLWELIGSGFAVARIDYAAMSASAATYAGLAIAVYECIKKQLRAYAAKRVKSAEISDSGGISADSAEERKIL